MSTKPAVITCDECGADITRTGNCEGYITQLASINQPTTGGFVTAMAAYPSFSPALHFCNGTRCFWDWAMKRLRAQAKSRLTEKQLIDEMLASGADSYEWGGMRHSFMGGHAAARHTSARLAEEARAILALEASRPRAAKGEI